VDTDVGAKRVVVVSVDGGATAEAMLAALQKWWVRLFLFCLIWGGEGGFV
jgi:hypothetical protein